MLKHLLYTGLFFLCFAGWAAYSLEPAVSAVPGRYSDRIEQISLRYGIHPRFAQALIWRESRFDSRSYGAKGEIGLTQIRMATVKDWAKAHHCRVPSVAELYEVELNLTIGLWYLDQSLKHWEGYEDQVKLALLEYNMGRAALLRAMAHCNGDISTLFGRCRSARYADQVIAKYNEYLQLDQNSVTVAQQ